MRRPWSAYQTVRSCGCTVRSHCGSSSQTLALSSTVSQLRHAVGPNVATSDALSPGLQKLRCSIYCRCTCNAGAGRANCRGQVPLARSAEAALTNGIDGQVPLAHSVEAAHHDVLGRQVPLAQSADDACRREKKKKGCRDIGLEAVATWALQIFLADTRLWAVGGRRAPGASVTLPQGAHCR